MSHKHIYNSSDGLVLKSLQGAVILNPSLRLHAPSKTVYVNPQSSNTQVSVISGGGAGHEPAHASYTGHGMLAASVSGDIFASPSSKQIAYALRLATFTGTDPNIPSKDILAIINNYTGDRLNFGSAIEKAKGDGLMVESVVVADDVSLLGNEGAKVVGPRGLAGNILVCKILGALAERNATLGRVKEVGNAVVGSLASIGVGLEHCHVPGRDMNGSVLGETECELGLGLHNEPGAERKELGDVERLVNEMIDKILESRGSESDSRFVEKDDETVLFVNNLGGMSQLEMGAVLKDVSDCLEHRGIRPRRVYLSSFMTSLNAPGFSIHLLNVSNIYRSLANGRGDLDILQLLDDPTDAHSWVGVRRFWPESGQYRDYVSEEKDTAHTLYLSHDEVHLSLNDAAERGFWGAADISSEAVKRGILRACRAVLEVEKDMTEFDTIVGDGDCGETFAMGAKAVISAIEKDEIVVAKMSPSTLVQRIGGVLEENMGGTIGALFTIYFTAWSSALKNMMAMETLSKTPSEALRSMSHHTPAKVGDRTIIDALQPFCEALKEGKGIIEASKKAKEGAEKTRGMEARLGRAVYVGSRPGKDSERELPPDPGAWGVAAIIEGFKTGFVDH